MVEAAAEMKRPADLHTKDCQLGGGGGHEAHQTPQISKFISGLLEI